MKASKTVAVSVAAAAMLILLTGCGGKDAVDGGQNRSPEIPAVNSDATGSFPYGEPEIVAERLNVPWDMAFVHDGRIFFTERAGSIRVMDAGKLLDEPLFTIDDKPVVSRGESGLLGLALDPEFSKNGYLYTYHTYDAKGLKNRVLRLKVEGNKAKLDRVLLDELPGQQTHDGGRIRFGPDGMLYITVGDAQERELSQDANSMAGKILRIRSDGAIPNDNPNPNSPVYSLGHRNPQGLAWQPATGKLFSSEHGQSSKDEINIIENGANYGWPLIEGDEFEANKKSMPGAALRKPLVHSGSTTWAPSGMTFITRGPWSGQLLVANLRGTQVLKLTLSGTQDVRVEKLEPLWKNEFGRIRNIAEGPDGSLYLLTNNRDGRGSPAANDDRIIRFKPDQVPKK